MKKKLLYTKATLLTIVLLLSTGYASMAATFTATTSGNWSSTTTWGGVVGPGFNITSADVVTIPTGVAVTLDQDLIINNASASLSVAGSLTGTTTSLALTAGTLTGTLAGTVTLSSLTVGTTGWITSLGPINVATFTNNQATLALGSVVSVSNSVVLSAGVIQLNTGGAIDLANNATINMAGGSYSILGGGLLTLAGNFNLLYSGTATTIGLESALAGLQNITVDLASASSQLALSANLIVAGVLSLQQGTLNLNGNSLTINGSINTASTGSVMGSATSDIIVNGTGSVGTIAFASGQTINNLTLNILTSGSISLASDVTVGGVLSLNGSSLNLNGYNLTIGGTVTATTTGSIIGSSTSGVTVNGTGLVGTLMFSSTGNTLGNMTVNIGSTGSVLLGSSLTVSGTLNLNGGSLNLNGQNLTVGGTINTSGSGSLGGNVLSNLILNGVGNAGTLAFTTGSEIINNLTINIGSSGVVALGSNATVGGTLTLAQGNISIGNYDLTIPVTGTVQGGSSASYIVTNAISSDTGGLIMTVANAGAAGMFQVGTIANYAPVNVTNNSTLASTFNVIAHPGVFADGTTGANIAATQSAVNTSWDVSSSLTSGANVNLTMFWNTAMQVNGFDNTQAYVSHYTGGAWNTSALTAATALSGGTYSLALTGVTSFSPFAVFDKNTTTTAIQVVKPEASFSIYPNPSADQINVTVLGAENFSVLKIYDALGNEVTSQRVVNALATIDISNLTPGVYFASLNGVMTKRFIKE